MTSDATTFTAEDYRSLLATARKMIAIMDLAHEPQDFEHDIGYEWALRIARRSSSAIERASASLGRPPLRMRDASPEVVAAQIVELALRAGAQAGTPIQDAHPFADFAETLVALLRDSLNVG